MDNLPAKKPHYEPEVDDTEARFIVTPVYERKARKFGVEEITYKAKFNTELQGRQLLDIHNDLEDMFGEVLNRLHEKYPDPNDKVRISVRHAGLDKDVTIHCQPKHNITAEVIMER